jgi:hypothetical protein
LSFQVMGRGQDNLPGTLSAPTPCVYSWSPPIPSEMKLTASTPQQTAYDTTTNATVALDLGNDPVRAVGGVGAQVTFTLTGNGTTQTKGPITVDGSSGTVSAVFSGVEPGASYRASAAVQPAHSGAPVTLNAPAVSTRSEWPNFSVIPTCAQSLLSCDVDVHIGGISSAATHGELFSLTNSWVQCGTAQEQLHQSDFDPAQSDVTAKLYQIAGFYNSCTVQIQLVEDAPSGAVPVFGGVPSPTETGTVNLGPPAHAAVGHDDFQVAWSTGASSVDINYTGSSDLGQLTDNWSETVQPPVGVQQCGSGQQQPDVTVSVPQDCVDLYGGLSGDWTVTLNFNNVSDGSAGGPFTYQLSGPPPGYQACDPTDLAAAWGATQADGIAVTVDGNADISGCSGWTYTLYDTTTDPPTQICPVSTTAADGNAPPATIDTTLCGIPPADGWSLHVAWTDTAGNPQSADFPLGPPPAS